MYDVESNIRYIMWNVNMHSVFLKPTGLFIIRPMSPHYKMHAPEIVLHFLFVTFYIGAQYQYTSQNIAPRHAPFNLRSRFLKLCYFLISVTRVTSPKRRLVCEVN